MTDIIQTPEMLLSGLRVANAGRGFVAAIAGKLLSDLSATGLANGAASDPAGGFHPAYEYLRAGEKPLDTSDFHAALDTVELLIVGGEDSRIVPSTIYRC